jgi:hypothetical protein
MNSCRFIVEDRIGLVQTSKYGPVAIEDSHIPAFGGSLLKRSAQEDDTLSVDNEALARQPGILGQVFIWRFMALQSPKWGAEAAKYMWKVSALPAGGY